MAKNTVRRMPRTFEQEYRAGREADKQAVLTERRRARRAKQAALAALPPLEEREAPVRRSRWDEDVEAGAIGGHW